MNSNQQMKEFISVTEELLACYAQVTHPNYVLVEEVSELKEQEEQRDHPIISECNDLIFKLRTFMEDASGDYALGVETGMQRAADMIENLVKRHSKGESFE